MAFCARPSWFAVAIVLVVSCIVSITRPAEAAADPKEFEEAIGRILQDFEEKGKLKEAADKYEELAQGAEKANEPEVAATCWWRTAKCLAEVDKNSPKGASGFQKAFELFRKIEHPLAVQASSDLAYHHFIHRNDFDAAEKWYLKSVEAFVEFCVPDASQIRRARNSDRWRAIAAHARDLSMPGGLQLAETLTALGDLYHRDSRFEDSELVYQASLKIFAAGGNPVATVWALCGLADLYDSRGQHDRAKECLDQAVKIVKEPENAGNVDEIIHVDHTRGNHFHNMGQLNEALKILRECLSKLEDLKRTNEPRYASVINDIGLIHLALDELDQARQLHSDALTVYKRNSPTHDDPAVATQQNNLAVDLILLRRYGEAVDLLTKALKTRERLLGPRATETGLTHMNLGTALWHLDEFCRAQEHLQLGLDIRIEQLTRVTREHPDVAFNQQLLAEFYAHQQRTAEAREAFDGARRILRRYVSREVPVLPEAQQGDFVWRKHRLDLPLDLPISFALAHSGETKVAECAVEWLVNGKTLILDCQIEPTLLARRKQDSKEVAKISKELNEVRRTLSHMIRSRIDPKRFEEFRDREQTLSAELRKKGVELDQLRGWLDLQTLRRSIPKDSAYIDIVRFKSYNLEILDRHEASERYAACVVQPDLPPRLIELGDAPAIDKAIDRVLEQLRSEPLSDHRLSTKNACSQLGDLSKAIFTPLLDAIDGKKRLIICPESRMWQIPWAALVLPDNRYAVEEYTVSYVVSGQNWVQGEGFGGSAGRSVVIADADFGKQDQTADGAQEPPVVSSIPRASAETGVLQEISKPFADPIGGSDQIREEINPAIKRYAARMAGPENSRPYEFFGDKATKATLNSVAHPLVLYIHTHGYFVPHPREGDQRIHPLMRCGLAFAGFNDKKQDGFLSGMEIAGLDLRGTDTVVLAACSTGLGDLVRGDGVVGLRKAFHLTGAKAVLATLWDIDAGTTPTLMKSFFENLAQGKTQAAALRDSQLELIQELRGFYEGAAHPYYWAPFALSGGLSQEIRGRVKGHTSLGATQK